MPLSIIIIRMHNKGRIVEDRVDQVVGSPQDILLKEVFTIHQQMPASQEVLEGVPQSCSHPSPGKRSLWSSL